MIEKYNKVIHWGDPLVQNITKGKLYIQEKIDGSLFRIWCHRDKKVYGSKSVDFTERVPDQMFDKIVQICNGMLAHFQPEEEVMIYGEYLAKPRHNTLCYDRVPKNHLVIFDIRVGTNWLKPSEVVEFVEKNNIQFDVIPTLEAVTDGKDLTIDWLKQHCLTRTSYLGHEIVEGIVFKNYEQYHQVEYMFGRPLFAKYVREDFKEKNEANWRGNTKKGFIEMLIEKYKTQARWNKAIIHLKERGEITNSPKDIPLIMKEVVEDVSVEEKENIKIELFDFFWKEIKSGLVKGIPQWYKDELLEGIIGGTENGEKDKSESRE